MSRYSHVTDEMLSAYLDDAVTASERSLVETAVADDPEVAWRLATMQHTVNLLGRLPDISLPRSFALTEAMIAKPVAETAGAGIPVPVSRQRPMTEPEKVGFWEAWRSFWQGGSILMRNAAAASFAAFLVLAAGGAMLSPQSTQQSQQENFALTAALPQAILDQASIDMTESARSDLRPQEASDSLAMESAQAEPIPLPAAAAGEVDEVAMAASDESVAPPLAERTLAASAPADQSGAAAPPPVSADAKVADEPTVEEAVVTESDTGSDAGVDSASEPITAAAMTMADAPVAEAETGVAEGDSEPDAAPEAMAATTSADDEASAAAPASDPAQRATTVESQAVESQVMEEPVEESAAETTLSKTSVSENRDDSSASINTGDAAMPDSLAEDEPVSGTELAAEEAHGEAVAIQAEAAPAEAIELAESPLSVQGQGPPTPSISAMNILQSDPILFVQMIALALTLFFAALWLLSHRTKSTPH